MREGVTLHEYWDQLGGSEGDPCTRRPQRTPPRKERMVAPYVSCAVATSGRKKPELYMYTGAETKGNSPARPNERAGVGVEVIPFRSVKSVILLEVTG